MKYNLNEVFNIDCLDGLKNLENESIDLIYLDPPFFSQKKHSLKDKNGKSFVFNDSWKNLEEYLEFLEKRFLEMKRILKKNGNIFIHCDKTANHHIRCLLEKVFGNENFRSEIIWSYKRWSNSKKGLLDGHQNIYHFTKSSDFKFRTIYRSYSLTTNLDQILQNRQRDKNGKSIYKKDENNEIEFSSEKKGVPLNDVWEIPFLNPKAKERVGYPTQKPVLLLERIIEIGSEEEDVILDPFCGSGTTLVAAKLLNRKYIGFDKNKEAVELAKNRLLNPFKTESDLMKKGILKYDNKTEKEKEILKRFNCEIVQRNRGLDGILKKKKNDKLIGIKIQKENETLIEAEKLLLSAMKKRKFEYSILVRTHNDLVKHSVASNIILVDDIDFLLNKNK